MVGHAVTALAAIMLTAGSSAWAASPLSGYAGRARVLVVSAGAPSDPAFVTQSRWLDAAKSGLADREVVVVRIVGPMATASDHKTFDANALRQTAKLPADRFAVALVGKDETVAFERAAPITPATLFDAIDAMPMRQQELKARGR